ncbi:MAG: EAL domain-containing protein [Pseudomonadota bacterium]|nr:EAL domain-containing protein [Pseudomonadota bacterium]
MAFKDTFRRGFDRATQPQVLFPLIAVVLLSVIWGTTFGVIRVNQSAAEHSAAVSSRELLDTYEAQAVRALREIDQALNLVKYWPERRSHRHTLSDLKDRGLLPPDLLFTVSMADREGTIVESTRPIAQPTVADQESFRQQHDSDTFYIGHLPRGSTGDAQLLFSRRLEAPDGAFDGVVMVAVEADFFVSGYNPSKLGQHGVLGLLGTDGVFRVRRTGDGVFSGDKVDYATAVPAADADATDATITTSPWDGVRRWTSARTLYGFPLAVLVGLSVDEQLATAHARMRIYLWWAALGSVGIVLLTGVLGRMSWQIGQGRLREGETKLAHAQRVEYLAYHDALTGLPNRSLFSKLLSQSINEAQRYGRQLAVAFLDLDRFKQINDTLGHEAGDQLLQEIARRLKECVRESDSVARLGGDEFVVLLPELGDGKYAAAVAQKILLQVAKVFTLVGQEFRVTASIGISTYPQDGLDEQTLTKNADIAMYQAKAEGKNNFQFYSDKLNANTLERLTLESSLRHALERNEFRLHYQAKRDIGTGKITGMEALLRWEHPDLGTVAPLQFIPLAEETGLIIPIGKWVLKTVCLQSVAWQQQGLPPLSIAVNLTARQFFDEQLLQDVTAILNNTGMNPRLLELEVNESLLIHDVEDTLRILTGLKTLGVRIAVDDFGTGYSSLATLQRFPLDTIKIDRSFIRDIAGSTEGGLADAIIAMGKSLSLTVVAQGVETREQADFLRTHACDELQGFYFNKPLPPNEFAQLLRDQATEVTYIGKRLGWKAV